MRQKKLQRRHALFEDNVSVFSSFAGHYYGKCSFCPLVEGKSFNTLDRRDCWISLVNTDEIGFLDLWIECIAWNSSHHSQWMSHISIKFEKWKNGCEQICNFQSICTEHQIIERFSGEVRIGKYNFVAMTHSGKYPEQFRTNERGNTF